MANGKGLHPIAWEVFCISKREGSLGFKNLHLFNKAFMMKIARELITKP